MQVDADRLRAALRERLIAGRWMQQSTVAASQAYGSTLASAARDIAGPSG
jgi:hypothetical protein